MSRAVLGGLVDRSAEWVKAVETGRLQTPKLNMLTKLATALDLRDLAELTGNDMAVSVSQFAPGAAHSALSSVRAALTEYRFTSDARPVSPAHLEQRLAAAWKVRHSSPDHRTQLGALLPRLIRDAQRAVRTLRGPDRREARRVLAGVYQLTDFYVAYQPSPELVWLVADRSLTEAQEADDPYAMASGAWAMVQALRDSGRWDEAIDMANQGAAQIQPYADESAPDDWHGIIGALQAETALTYARRGRHGEAWHYWESANAIARKLGPGYRHVQSSFGLPVMKANAVTLGLDLRRGGEAMRAADFDPAEIVSIPRRARHMIEVARVHALRGDSAAALATLDRAERTAPETARFNGWARELTLSLLDNPPSGAREQVRSLADRIGVR